MAYIKKHTSGLLWLGLLITVIAALAVTLQVAAKPPGIAKVSYYVGDFRIKEPQRDEWKKAVMLQSLVSGDKVQTKEDSRGEVAFADGSIIRIDANSALDIVELKNEKAGQATAAKVWSGKVWANVNKMSKKAKFELASPTAVAAVRGTVYRMSVAEDQTTKIAVYSGEVKVDPSPDFFKNKVKKQGGTEGEIEGPHQIEGPHEVSLEQWVKIVKAQMEITIRPDGTYDIVNFNPVLDSQDEWVKWNHERDKAQGRK